MIGNSLLPPNLLFSTNNITVCKPVVEDTKVRNLGYDPASHKHNCGSRTIHLHLNRYDLASVGNNNLWCALGSHPAQRSAKGEHSWEAGLCLCFIKNEIFKILNSVTNNKSHACKELRIYAFWVEVYNSMYQILCILSYTASKLYGLRDVS